ncbi:ras-related protein Rab-18-B-like [Hippocampus zosterae]|uniref:ras-related protein Rab-18-B-like n=1 Tax=Hippocampus zosterae TaxID=109293 RepID=UPI00223E8AAA|nr:ras-related protein Rab-18-B-like [Hippocampus zosterae]
MKKREALKVQVIVVGESGVGKSTMLRVLDSEDREPVSTTVGERLKTLTPTYYAKADGALLVFDLSDRDSFLAAEGYLLHLRQAREGLAILLVGNKSDKSKKVSDRETSALVTRHSEEAFSEMVRLVLLQKQVLQTEDRLDIFESKHANCCSLV